MKWTGRTALVTGGTSGIGLATARALAGQGMNVAINARSHAPGVIGELDALARDGGARCILVTGDVRNGETATHLVAEAVREFGRIDTVVHAAGGPAPGRLPDVSTDAWLDAFAVHVHSAFHLFRAAHGALAVRGGSVTFLSSAAALRGCPGTVPYQVVKAALVQLARALARDHAAEGIRVNCVAPGIIRTPFQNAMTEEARRNNLANRIPLGREGQPDQVASLILQLIENDFITGETFVIDGGMSMRMV
ncbi:SDR family oxidoreductase [Alsobacter sp. SYSU M60028]|uniref:SDR family oxidoreductase n=1 Tax=Alsobacter ponti TaxID=2962936 RepID=A0ABT1L7F8_9HYPH|nr:SDR family oxidoreductase [Alsobacter ponti]MCP8937412.1 SDR family oxidoreductase [Alsobacter ponti]